MANMSYCRFGNTLSDFRDCFHALERIIYDGEGVSQREWECAERLYHFACDFVATYEDYEADEVEINIE